MNIQRLLSVSLILCFLFCKPGTAEINTQTGERLYKQYCTSCHKIDSKLIGPPLRDVGKRRPEDWLIAWIHNDQLLREEGDKDAIALFKGYNVDMPAFPLFTDDEIRSILVYIDSLPSDVPIATPVDATPFSQLYLLYGVIGLFLFTTLILLRTNYLLLREIRRSAGESFPLKKKIHEILSSKKFMISIVLLFIFLITFAVSESAMHLGYSKNYEPIQPIAFSHKIHAGIAQINCRYCHSDVEKGKTAGIPALSTCMNCHLGIQEGENSFQTAEIQKLISYYKTNKAVVWTRIHNLPDFVYFNHSQHVVVGLIDCETCHGQVDQMDVMYQFASLSMGWCVNCHRSTDVKFADNRFYSLYSAQQKQIHDSMGVVKDSGNVHITEEMLGGTECQRCHY